jgi:murein DD-endopeptidase MepM/ murein hydrolase activator NlpD
MVAPVPSSPAIDYPYGSRNSRYISGYHTGDDYFAAYGVPVVATREGVVEVAGGAHVWGDSYGIIVVVRVGDVKCLYAHLSKATAKVGDRVGTGEKIGEVGTSGTNSTGSHLHYEERTEPWRYNNVDRKPQFQDYSEEEMTPAEEQRIIEKTSDAVVQKLLKAKIFGEQADKPLQDVSVQTALRRTYLGHDQPDEV